MENNNNIHNPKRKGGHGRRKVEIAKISKKSALATTFTKRRKGLFKKAAELCVLCDVEAAIVVFSPCLDKPYGFGHKSVDSVINRYLNLNSGVVIDDLNWVGDGFWWDSEKIEDLGITELKEVLGLLEEQRKKLVERVNHNGTVLNCNSNSNSDESRFLNLDSEIGNGSFNGGMNFDELNC